MVVTWVDPPDRFDGVGRTLVLRYAAGAVAPASVTDGLAFNIPIARGVNTANFTTGAGQFSVSVFAGYTDSGVASNERYSEGPTTEDGMSVTATA
jgi:hypothetical protein